MRAIYSSKLNKLLFYVFSLVSDGCRFFFFFLNKATQIYTNICISSLDIELNPFVYCLYRNKCKIVGQIKYLSVSMQNLSIDRWKVAPTAVLDSVVRPKVV